MEGKQSCCSGLFGTRTRFAILPLVLLCLAFIWANILSFNLGTVCINNHAAKNSSEDEPISISQRQTTFAIAAMAAGALVGMVPTVFFVNRVGSRIVFTFLGMVTAAATLLMPVAIKGGFGWLIVCRVLQGVAFSGIFPVIGAFMAKWTYHKQTGLFNSLLVSYVQIAPIFSNGVGGPLCDHVGWESIFYVHGGITAFLFLVIFVIFRSSPEDHPCVTDIEAEKVARGKPKQIDSRVPYAKILKTKAIWAIWIAALGNAVITNVFFVFSPIYLAKALHFSTSKSGFNAMYPPLCQLITKIGTGFVSDRIQFISNVWKFRIFNTLSFCGSGAVCVALAFMEDHHPSANSPVIAVALIMLGINAGGFYKAGPFLSKQYSPFISGMVSQCNCLILLVIPFIVEAITPDNTVGQWKIVFLLVAVILVATNVVFVIFIQGEPCDWTNSISHIPSISTIRVYESFRSDVTLVKF